MIPLRRPRRTGEESDLPLPAHPYRDTAALHAILAAIIVGFAMLTGGSFATALVVAVVYFVAATTWSWWGFRRRIRAADAAALRHAASGDPAHPVPEDSL